MKDQIYLNCAASSFPKPDAVLQSVEHSLHSPPGDPGRGTNAASSADACRDGLSVLLGCKPSELHFSSGATESANLIIAGLDMENAHVIATATEHNSILRPLYNHPAQPEISIAPCDARGWVDPSAIEALIRPNTRYLFVNHCSNVTGCVQDLQSISKLAIQRGLILIVDASQSVGCLELNVVRDGIDILIFTGHKNLFGISGIGGAYIRSDLPVRIVKTGGTGTDSLWLTIPTGYTNREPGTPNVLGLTALTAGTAYIQSHRISAIQLDLQRKRNCLIAGLQSIPGLRVFHAEPDMLSGPVVSFVSEYVTPGDFGYILQESYGITVRAGFHCCPLIHSALGCEDGTIRVSFSVLTSDAVLDRFLVAVREIQEGASSL